VHSGTRVYKLVNQTSILNRKRKQKREREKTTRNAKRDTKVEIRNNIYGHPGSWFSTQLLSLRVGQLAKLVRLRTSNRLAIPYLSHPTMLEAHRSSRATSTETMFSGQGRIFSAWSSQTNQGNQTERNDQTAGNALAEPKWANAARTYKNW